MFSKRGDRHPVYVDAFYSNFEGRRGVQKWTDKERIEKDKERDRIRSAKKRSTAEGRQRQREISRNHYNNNKEYYLVRNGKRRNKENDNIDLTGAQYQALKDVHKLRKELDLIARGAGAVETFHVHHVWPLEHPEFCGLNAPWNVDIIWVSRTFQKSNKRPDQLPS